MHLDRLLAVVALGVGVYALYLSRYQITLATPTNPAAARARATLAVESGAAESDITVERVTGEVFPDTSLGVPDPTRSYAQVLTPGFRVILRLGGSLYEYHTDASGDRAVRCPVCTATLQGAH
jgi:hypothetical protein